MAFTLAKKVAVRREHTGAVAQDRAQRMAQQVGQAHEITKVAVTDHESRIALLEALLFGGRSTIAMANANQVISADQRKRILVQATGALATARTLSGFYQPLTEAESYIRFVENNTTGGFNLVLSTGSGTTAAIGAGGKSAVLFAPGGASIYGPL